MKPKKGPQLGWTLGGIGSILWLLLLAGVLFAIGNQRHELKNHLIPSE